MCDTHSIMARRKAKAEPQTKTIYINEAAHGHLYVIAADQNRTLGGQVEWLIERDYEQLVARQLEKTDEKH